MESKGLGGDHNGSGMFLNGTEDLGLFGKQSECEYTRTNMPHPSAADSSQ